MNKFESVTKSLRWFVALLLVVFVAGCGSSSDTPSPLSSAKALTSFTVTVAVGTVVGTIDEPAKTVALTVPYGTSVTTLVATFTSTGTGVTVGTPAVAQVSNTTANDFTSPVIYTVTAADGTTAAYTVTIIVASATTKAITAFSFAAYPAALVTIDEAAKTIAVVVPYGTNVTALVATFTTTGESVSVASVAQVSGTTPNNFTTSKAYLVTAGNTTAETYTVSVTFAENSAKAITAYSFVGYPGAPVTIDDSAKTIVVTLPYGTTVTALVATFTTTGTGVPTVAGVNQVSGTTQNNFTTSKAYLVTAANSTTATYTVTVVFAANTAKAITAYSFVGYSAYPGVITEAAHTIAVTLPSGTVVTALTATFTSTGTGPVTIGGVTQVSGAAPSNDFTTSKSYLVTAADSTTESYVVTVTVAAVAGPPAVDLRSIITNNFVVLAQSMITEATPVNGAITGNIGVSPAAGSTITVACAEMLTGKVYQVDDAYTGGAECSLSGTVSAGANKTIVDNAVAHFGLAYTDASDPATPAGVGASNLNLLGGSLPAGTNFVPGVYTWGSNVNINGNITLTGGASDVWIFQMSGNLAVASCGSCSAAADGAAIKVILSGGAVASNVFWQVGGATTTLGTYSTFNGNILTAPAGLIAIQTGAVLHGRALSGTSVALDGNIVGP